jgi:Tfp pilus assembly protein PilV
MKRKHTFMRRGMAMIAVLVAIAAITVVLSVVTVQVFAQRHTVRQRQRQLQADWAARAGVEWAADRLLSKAEPFTADKEDLIGDAKIHVVVEKAAGDIFTITADASVAGPDEQPVVRTASARFRRTPTRLEPIAIEK